jgi:Flp pilus assembly protein TadG
MKRSRQRRGVVVVWTAVLIVSLLGFAALSIDIGYLYLIRTELQSCADAAALAAASRLSVPGGNTEALAREAAAEYAALNKVGNRTIVLDPETDIVFGQAVLNHQTGRYQFVPNAGVTDGVRLRVRRTADSPNGAVPLFFANVFGRSQKDMSAEATAILIPRDIAIVADMSASHNDDSELRHIKEPNITINLWGVWAGLPGGMSPSDPNYSVQNAGPRWGAFMRQAGFGTMTLNASYNPATDSGLTYLPKTSSWTNATITDLLTAQGYNATERSAIMSGGTTTSTWKARVCTALGLCTWRSNITGGKWSVDGLPRGSSSTVAWDSNLTWTVPYLGKTLAQSSSYWSDYCDYVASSSSQMVSDTYGNSAFRYRFGVKTCVNHFLEEHPSYSETPALGAVSEQPMQSVKDAVCRMMQMIEELQTNDQVSLEVYSTWGHHEIDLTQNYSAITTRINQMQAGYYDNLTNMGDGEQKAIDELTSSRARDSAKKVMILLTDGNANVDGQGHTYDEYAPDTPAKQYAVAKATAAAALGIRIYTVAVGARADTAGMAQIAQIGNGSSFYASGSIADYTEQLQAIFETLSGKRPIALIE